MSDEKVDLDDDDVIEDTETEEPDVEEEEEAEAPDETDDTEAEAEDDDELVVSIHGVTPDPEDEEEARAPAWVRDLRKQYRDEKRRSKELEQRIEQMAQGQEPARPALGAKPTLESADYDTERYEGEIAAWYEGKREHDDQLTAMETERANTQKDWEVQLGNYNAAKERLKVPDFSRAEEVVQDTLSVMQQGLILQGAEDATLLVYALGKNPIKAKELASINDPVKFAFAVARLEKDLKVTKRKAASQPEKRLTGTGRPSGSVDNTLDRLRAEAERTGDYTKVTQYKRQARQAAK
tara:strand:- start:526 stop:1410 length:885 start_codon:yes stop_codon:yes gene_type:complete